MAFVRLVACFVLYTSLSHIPASLGVILRTNDKIVWANEFEAIELSCIIETSSTNISRIEWKKIKNGVPIYVYLQNKVIGDLEHRALLREPANFLILNTTRSDTAVYRCEVVVDDDQKDYDEIEIRLLVRVKPAVPRCSVPEAVTVGTSAELQCRENEGFPAPLYGWFHNNEELPQDRQTFVDSSYSINPDTGGLKFGRVRKEDAGEYYCQAKNEAGRTQCPPQTMEVLDVDILGICLKSFGAVLVFCCLTASIRLCFKRGCFYKKGHKEDVYRDADEGHFRHKPSFVI